MAATALEGVASRLGPPVVLPARTGWTGAEAIAACEAMLTAGQASVRVHRTRPTLALSRRDARRPGVEAAKEAARAAGYAPLVRLAGGRVVAYDEGCVVVDLVGPRRAGDLDVEQRFVEFSERIVRALGSLGVPAARGPVAGEYCPGDHSVNAAGTVKIAGTAQRVTLSAWLCTAVLVVRRSAGLVDVLDAVHEPLGYEWDPGSVGCVRDFVAVDEAEVVAALLDELGR